MHLSSSRTAAPLHDDSIRARPRSLAVHESRSDVKQTTHAGAAGASIFTLQQHSGADAADGSRVLKRCATAALQPVQCGSHSMCVTVCDGCAAGRSTVDMPSTS